MTHPSGLYRSTARSGRTAHTITLLSAALQHTRDAVTALRPCEHQPTWPTGPLTNEHQAQAIHAAVTAYRRDNAESAQWICLCPKANPRTLERLATHWLILWHYSVRYVLYPDRYSLHQTRRAALLVDDYAAWVITQDPTCLLGIHRTLNAGAEQ